MAKNKWEEEYNVKIISIFSTHSNLIILQKKQQNL